MSRLFEQYNSEIKKSMQEKFQYGNVMEIPKLEKIVINIGVGDAVGNAKALEAAVNDLTIIAGQKPVITKAKKSIANFKVRNGFFSFCDDRFLTSNDSQVINCCFQCFCITYCITYADVDNDFFQFRNFHYVAVLEFFLHTLFDFRVVLFKQTRHLCSSSFPDYLSTVPDLTVARTNLPSLPSTFLIRVAVLVSGSTTITLET